MKSALPSVRAERKKIQKIRLTIGMAASYLRGEIDATSPNALTNSGLSTKNHRLPKFIVKIAREKEASFVVDREDIFIGRVSSINDICLNDPSVSRQHAHIKKREEGYTVYDLKSLNGVILNGARVSRALLKDGDEIRLGEVVIQIQLRQETQEEELSDIEQSEQTHAQSRAETKEVIVETSSGRRTKKDRKKKERKKNG